MDYSTDRKALLTRYSTERRLLARYNVTMAKYHRREILLREKVHNANLNFLNPYVLKGFEITPNAIGYNQYYYTWDPIGSDRQCIKENIQISVNNHENTRQMTRFVNESSLYTLMLCCDQHFKYKYGTRIYLVYLEFKHYRHTYRRRHRDLNDVKMINWLKNN